MSKNLPQRPAYTYTEEDWNQIRAHFMGSILVELHLHKLAQNVNLSWPIKGSDEVPAKYLEFSFDELADAPGLAGQPARLQLLLDILKETASFDDPFQSMVESRPDPAKPAFNSDELLQKLGIPPDFPLEFTSLSADTKALCHAEGAVTLGRCVALFQKMAQNVILGGEIRHLLNCLVHADEGALTNFLPLRRGARGLHLPEAIGILIRNLPESERIACLVGTPASEENIALAENRLIQELPRLLEWFPADSVRLREIALEGESIERYFHPLNDPALEHAAARLVRHYHVPPAPPAEKPKPNLIHRFTGLFRANR